MKIIFKFILILIFSIGVIFAEDNKKLIENLNKRFTNNRKYITRGFNIPVGPPHGRGYYNAQAYGKRNRNFGNNFHLGEDWNGIRGGNTDLGDPVFSIANGLVVFSGDGGPGWGNVVRIVHKLKKGSKYEFVESVYGHLKKMNVREGDFIGRGQPVGTIGNVNGLYWAHLHLELRWNIFLPLGGGYDSSLKGFLNPTRFIRRNRR